jgi:hypothetical protein
MEFGKALMNIPKVMVLLVWGRNGPALAETVPPNPRVSTKYLCEFAIPHMEANAKTHRPNSGLKGITFYRDDAPSHAAKVTLTKISELGMSQTPYLPYS